MSSDKAETAALRKRAERVARREFEHHERRQCRASEDPDSNRRAFQKRRLNWKNKFNSFALFIALGSL
ncbi:MAG: hypothetical protein P8X86_14005 [Desulfofustis sp.]|jgi:hypothetical protein